jgi:hypothetical protein
MRTISLIALAATALAPVAAGAATPVQKEMAVWQAYKDKNGKAFKAMMAPAYVGVYADGNYNLARELDTMKAVKLDSFKIGGFSSRMIDSDDMLMTYTVDVKGMHGKDDISGKYYAASLWHRANKKWLGVYHSEIKAK